ncbi:MAG: sugar phosphate nucleotidyltransferase, partial [Deltaproteobacteria bacterium]|nr:sugar phosphate nucleotidyltransferase [Deltaproteobacteria bacterium]
MSRRFFRMLDSYHISRCRYKQNTLYQSGLNKFHSSNSPTQLGLDPFFDTPFYVIYSDNFSQWDIRKLKFEYERNNSIGTVAVHWREDVTQSGMVEFDQNNRILRLVEKPKPEGVTSHYVNAGFYYLNPRVFNYIPEGKPCDFAFNVFP